RAFLVYEGLKTGKIGEFDAELIAEFFRALAFNAGITLHLINLRGDNAHHIAEATFKAFAVAFRRAVAENKRTGTPSTKGVL
ncbi:MAG: imidazoleglycerol-phosphate dehydratase, partial [Campylobacter sp.]|nr:imidazoleglycerol-phosphate dehydratase [Campylobacter sp.]